MLFSSAVKRLAHRKTPRHRAAGSDRCAGGEVVAYDYAWMARPRFDEIVGDDAQPRPTQRCIPSNPF
jgi:hypothetical protein